MRTALTTATYDEWVVSYFRFAELCVFEPLREMLSKGNLVHTKTKSRKENRKVGHWLTIVSSSLT